MTDTDPTPTALLSPADEARVSLANAANDLAAAAVEVMAADDNAAPGDALRAALKVQQRAELLVLRAVIAERENGTSWARLAAASGTTKQAAHEKWSGAVSA